MPNDNNPNQAPAQPAPPAPSEPESLDGNNLEPPAGAAVNSSPADTDTGAGAPAKKSGKFSLRNNMYLMVFIMIILVGASVVFVSIKSAKPKTTTQKASSLTDQQISSLKGNTTLVGDAKQTLDIQSNSIFEGQILARGDLNVAGTVKVGGPLSLPAINVGGSGTFGQVGVSGSLNVAGDSTLQGALAVSKNLTVAGSASFGSLNVSSLGVTTLNLKGDISQNQHIITSGGVPGRSNGTAVGSGGTASVSGSDTAGTINISTGGSPPAGCFITVNFAKKFGFTPHVVISPSNSSAAALQYYTTNRSSSGFSVCTANAPAAGTTYSFDYIVIN
jgi:hypothetical protein